jgi:hypothetical protein
VIRIRNAPALLIAISTLHAIPALAQSRPPPSRVEVGVGMLWDGSNPFGTRAANETTASSGTLSLFSTTSELAAAIGFEGRIGVRVAKSLVVEGQFSYMKPELRVAASADAEGAAAVTAGDVIQQFTIGGRALWFIPGRRWPPRLAPFAMAGGGYLRQLHEQATLVQTGRFYQFGGGVSVLLVSSSRSHATGAGVRFDLSALVRSKGVAFDDGSRTAPAAGASAFVRF